MNSVAQFIMIDNNINNSKTKFANILKSPK